MKVLLGAFGDPGHAFPMLALGQELVARGHAVTIQTWRRWEEPARAAGMAFAAAPEYQVFPTREQPLKPFAAAVRAARETVPVVEEIAPDAVVADILTTAPALAAELCGVPFATLVPHVHPDVPPGFPPYALGARLPRTRLGARLWRSLDGVVRIGLERGRVEYNGARARLGLAPLPYVHTGLSRSLTLVATLPQLEYPRAWPSWLRVVGPLLWDSGGERAVPPAGSDPLVLVAVSTSQDRSFRLARAALAGLARESVRVLVSGAAVADVPHNAVVVPWLSYTETMPACDLVICHGGHGTLARALTSGCPVVVCPSGGDMPENAARVDWAGVGVRLPERFCTPSGVRLAVRRALARPALRARARELAAWAAEHPGPPRAADELERWAATRPA
jgi:UDP:flavonoid glycosyltransferase YjiC (YdhE family)